MNKEIVGAGLLMEELFNNKVYQKYSKAKNAAKAAKDEMKKRISLDQGRMLFEKQGVIARYIKDATYEYNVEGLNEFLWDIGILHEVARFEDVVELNEFKKPVEHYTKFNLGKLGRTKKEVYDLRELSNEELIEFWLKEKNEESNLETQIEAVKEKMLNDTILNELPEGERKLGCTYGSVSLLNKKRTHHADQIIKEFGHEFVIQNSKPSMNEIEKFITKGYLTHRDLEQFRTLIDLQYKFVMITAESYQKQWDVLQYNKAKQSQNLQELWANAKELSL